jgi:zinc transport system substrate-binding protein
MKKYLAMILVALLAIVGLTGCGKSAPAGQNNNDKKKFKVVTTIFPEYDWVKNIMGDKFSQAEVTLLLNNGTDMHSYQPTMQDMIKVSDCDLFIYVGGESDQWVKKALQERKNKNMQVVNLMEVLGDRVKEEAEEGHEHKVGEDKAIATKEPGILHKSTKEVDKDEHVWLSLRNAQLFCTAITKALSEADSANAAVYETNLKKYEEKLTALDKEYEKTIQGSQKKVLVFGDRFPFRYLIDDYGLKYYAAFAGCSAETEASFKTVRFLAGKLDALGLNNIFTLEKSDQKIAKTIIQNTQAKKQNILALDSMQSTTAKDIAGGATYLQIMTNNLAALKRA